MMKRKRENSENFEEPAAKHANTLRDEEEAEKETYSAAELQLRQVMNDFVRLYERLNPEDDPSTKPSYSYSELVFLAILRSPNFCLPIGEIYKYIQARFAFFRTSSSQHWKNAVRHSLSKTKCFSKISVGRGVAVTKKLQKATYLWCLVPSSIISFARGDYRPSSDRKMEFGYYSLNAGQFWGQVAIYLERKLTAFRRILSRSSRPGEIFEEQLCKIPSREEIFQRGSYFERRNLEQDRNVMSTDKQAVVSEENVHVSQAIMGESKTTEEDASTTKVLNLTDTNRSANTSAKDDSGIVSDVFLSNTSADISLTDANIIEHSLNLLLKKESDLTQTSSPVTNNITYLGQSSNQDDRKTPELPDLRNVSPLNLSPILATDPQEMPDESSKISMHVAYSTPHGYRPPPPYNPVMTSQPLAYHHNSLYPYPAFGEENGFNFGLPPLYQYSYHYDSGGNQEFCF
ncbi:forkhead box protein N4-like [Saccostrea echinata]|uniref:forkhead box protein N4-like n=1 Tax=Saccostrea echinata TaxID=191078 RepID=UPI002A7FCDFE|nr:forkhead box protein N4-like [Saccostrea echinata]